MRMMVIVMVMVKFVTISIGWDSGAAGTAGRRGRRVGSVVREAVVVVGHRRL
jgi:hypothetical protein